MSSKASFTSSLFIEVSVPRQESERSCIILYVCKRGDLSLKYLPSYRHTE
jgi:hypothetical protein